MTPLVRRVFCTAFILAALAAPVAALSATGPYSGTGARTLAPFRLTQGATLRWQTSGGLFGGLFALKMLNQRADLPNPQLAFSRARSGTVRLPAGRYVLRVDTLGGRRWQITIG